MGLPRADGCRLPAELRDVPSAHLASCDDYLTKKLPASPNFGSSTVSISENLRLPVRSSIMASWT